jgi:hypothetical protein
MQDDGRREFLVSFRHCHELFWKHHEYLENSQEEESMAVFSKNLLSTGTAEKAIVVVAPEKDAGTDFTNGSLWKFSNAPSSASYTCKEDSGALNNSDLRQVSHFCEEDEKLLFTNMAEKDGGSIPETNEYFRSLRHVRKCLAESRNDK